MQDSLNVAFLKTTVGDLDQKIKDAAKLNKNGDDTVLEMDELCKSPLVTESPLTWNVISGDHCRNVFETVQNYLGFRFVEEDLAKTKGLKPVDRPEYTKTEREELLRLLGGGYRDNTVKDLLSSHGAKNLGYFSRDNLDRKLGVLVSRIFDIDDIPLLISGLANDSEAIAMEARRVLRSFADLLPDKSDELIAMLKDPKVDPKAKRQIEVMYGEWKYPHAFMRLFETMLSYDKNSSFQIESALDEIATSSPENLRTVLTYAIRSAWLLARVEDKYKNELEELKTRHAAELEVVNTALAAGGATKKELSDIINRQIKELSELEDARTKAISEQITNGAKALSWIVGRINLKDERTRTSLANVIIGMLKDNPNDLNVVLPALSNIRSYAVYQYLMELLDSPDAKSVHHLCLIGLGRQYRLVRSHGDYAQESLEKMTDDILSTAKNLINTIKNESNIVDVGRTNLSVEMQEAIIGLLNDMYEDGYGIALVTRSDSKAVISALLSSQLGVKAAGDPKELKEMIIRGMIPEKMTLLLMLHLGKMATPEAGEALDLIMKKEEDKLSIKERIKEKKDSLSMASADWKGRNVDSELEGYANAAMNTNENMDKRFRAIDKICEVGGQKARSALDKIAKAQTINPSVFPGFALANLVSFGSVAKDPLKRISMATGVPEEVLNKTAEIMAVFAKVDEELGNVLTFEETIQGNLGNLDMPPLKQYKPVITFDPIRLLSPEAQDVYGRTFDRLILIDYLGSIMVNEEKLGEKADEVLAKIGEENLDYCGALQDMGIVKESELDPATGEYIGGCSEDQHGPGAMSKEKVREYLKGVYKKVYAAALSSVGGKHSLKYLEAALVMEKDAMVSDFIAMCISKVSGDKRDSLAIFANIIKNGTGPAVLSSLKECGELSKAQSDTIAIGEDMLARNVGGDKELRDATWRLILNVEDLLLGEAIKLSAQTGDDADGFFSSELNKAINGIDVRFMAQKNYEERALPYHMMEMVQKIADGPYTNKKELTLKAIQWFSDIEFGSCNDCRQLDAEVELVRRALRISSIGGRTITQASKELLVDTVAEMKGRSAHSFMSRLVEMENKAPAEKRLDGTSLAYVVSKIKNGTAGINAAQHLKCSEPRNVEIENIDPNKTAKNKDN